MILRKIMFYISLCLLIVVGLALFFVLRNDNNFLRSLFTPISIASRQFTKDSIKETDGRTNILILGSDQRSPKSTQNSVLTDTIMILSIGKEKNDVVIISIPRDLWIEQINEKINALYAWNLYPYQGKGKEVEKVKDKIYEITGLQIHYYAIVGFNAFQDAIEAVGGIEIYVANAFVDYQYPVEGKEDAPNEQERYMTVRFEQGNQVMNGEKALHYARSRHSANPIEAGDFARARRQQAVLVALEQKVLKTNTLLNPQKLTELFDAYQKNVVTDITVRELLYYSSIATTFTNSDLKKIVLSDEGKKDELPGSGTLMTPTTEERESKYSGKYVLVPKTGNYDEIKVLIRNYLFGDIETKK